MVSATADAVSDAGLALGPKYKTVPNAQTSGIEVCCGRRFWLQMYRSPTYRLATRGLICADLARSQLAAFTRLFTA